MHVLEQDDWQAAAQAHRDRLAPYVEPHLQRRRLGQSHPVHDFMFQYYSQRPAALQRWHPGYGVMLQRATAYRGLRGYDVNKQGAAVSAAYLASHTELIRGLRHLLTATARRQGNFGCFGLHEWAMVFEADDVRHPVPLRLSQTATNDVVRNHRIACSHFDAFRFFTPSARPLNQLQPRSENRPDFEQPGCLHAGMDLYKHAFRLSPLIPSELVADCFALAWEIRILDMRAAPYDMRGWTIDPAGEPWTAVPIETPQGKADYAQQQRDFAERGAALRQRLIGECERLIAAAPR